MKLSHLLFAAGLALLATPALAATSEPAPAAPRFAFLEALLGPSTVEAPKAAPVVEAPQACPEPALDAPPAVSPAASWAASMRAFAER